MTIVLTPTESEEYFFNSLCNSLGQMGGYGLELTYNEGEYQESRKKLKSPSYEDVLLQMLKDGYSLTMTDIEGEGEYTKTITINDVHEKVMKTPLHHLNNMIEENDDSDTGDVILQTVFFDDIVFG